MTCATDDLAHSVNYSMLEVLAYAVIGIHPNERQRKQRARVNVAVTKSSARQQPLNFGVFEQRIFDVRIAPLVPLLRQATPAQDIHHGYAQRDSGFFL